MKIAIIGAGGFGTVLGDILSTNGNTVEYYDPKYENSNLTCTVKDSKYILLAVPSEVAPYILPHLPIGKPLIIATKGILDDKLFNYFKDYMVLSGPGFAQDIKKHKKTFLTITDKRLAKLFKADYLIFDYTDDKKGVLMCGALKNVYAIMAGYLNLEKKSREWRDYIKAVKNEMYKILELNGARADTFNLACGQGDLELTCGLPSRNFEYGLRLRKNHNYQSEKTVEGLSTIKKIRHGAIKIPDEAVILKRIINLSEKLGKSWN